MNNIVKIDGEKLINQLKNKGVNICALSSSIGYSRNYIFAACYFRTNKMRISALDAICNKCGIDRNEIIVDDTQATVKAEQKGLHIDLQMNGSKLKLTLLNDGEEMYHANAIIQGDDDVSLTKAISSAAFMIYKLAEQKQMEE